MTIIANYDQFRLIFSNGLKNGINANEKTAALNYVAEGIKYTNYQVIYQSIPA